MKKAFNIIATAISFFLILLFVYASVSKLNDFENFQLQIGQSPILGTYPKTFSFATIFCELAIVVLLSIRNLRLIGLYASLGMMAAFTLYIYLILNFSGSIPCSCGGILEKMDWNEHFIFNLACVVLIIIAVILTKLEQKKKLTAAIQLMVTVPTLAILILFFLHIDDNKGNFERKIISPLKLEHKTLEFPSNNYYFAGHCGDSLFLGNRRAPLLLSTVTPDFSAVKVDTIKLYNYTHQFVSVTINVLYPYFSVSDGKVPVIYEGKLPALNAYDTGIDRLYFSRFYMIAPKKYVFKTMLVKKMENELGLLNTDRNEYQIFPDVLKKEVDGVFDTDGDLTIDQHHNQIIYTHFYRNEIITADFDLGNVKRYRTVDSLSHTPIETKTLGNGQKKLLRSPSVINQIQTVSDDKFYNVSKMRGQNETYKDFRNNDVIDVYESRTKKYLYSFYIRNEKRNKIKGILSTKHYLYVLSGNQLTRYAFK